LGSVDVARLTPPAPLAPDHDLDKFQCSEPSLERWLKERARRNEAQGASRTYVVAAGREVVGYYCLSAGAVSHEAATSSIRRNMPDPIPVIVLGRLAVHPSWEGRGLGSGLLKDAVLRSIAAAEALGVRALLCHAISPRAKEFYLRYGFVESPLDPLTLMLNLSNFAAKPADK
jgi:GNAT superfamily N-acetyltransferase